MAINELSKATIVFPDPTSPCRSLFICAFDEKSFLISLTTFFCALVSEKDK